LKGALVWSGGSKNPRASESGVAQKLEHGTVKLVGSGLDGSVDHRAAATAEFRGIVAGLDLEFLDRIHIGVENVAGVIVRVVVDAVQHEVV
jgi:hypothetical protein